MLLHLLTVTVTITSQDVGRSVLGSHCNLDKQGFAEKSPNFNKEIKSQDVRVRSWFLTSSRPAAGAGRDSGILQRCKLSEKETSQDITLLL
ncbi:hypothetical protein TNCV_2633361 [Trichonephila clavipes]|nr:hypothetical protein TNCV_2633361 [Trichonephila clavipes]